jgi:hypothetical protein
MTESEDIYANIAWSPADVMTLRPRLTEEEAREFLLNNENHIRNRLSELGFEVIEDLLDYDFPTGKDRGFAGHAVEAHGAESD